jgi:1-acyl-sn-glycerol-3-phosphate acyltransferase
MLSMFLLNQIKAIFITVVLTVFVLFPACLLALPFDLNKRLRIVSPAWRLFANAVLRAACLVKIKVAEDHRSEAFKTVPPFGIYIANHQSFLDIPLIATVYQLPPIMKKEVLYIPIFGWLGWVSGAMPVSRSNGHSRKRVFSQARKRILNERVGVQVYPEGTRSKTSRPKDYREIKRTLMVFAFNEKIPVVPTSIYGTRGVLTKHGFINPHRDVGIIVHQEIDPKNYQTADEFCRACWAKVHEGHDSIKAQLALLSEK